MNFEGLWYCIMCGRRLDGEADYCGERCKRIEQETIRRLRKGLEDWNAGAASASGSSGDSIPGKN